MKIFFLPMDAHGHVNSCIGLARMLQDFGHQIVFGVPKRWSPSIEKYKFDIEILDDPSVPEDQDLQEKWGSFMGQHADAFGKEPKDQLKALIEPATRAFIEYVKIIDDQLASVFEKSNPDLIILDFYVTVPAVVKSGRPWMLLFSCNPLRLYEGPKTPMAGLGLSVDTDPSVTMQMQMLMMDVMKEVKSDFDKWLISKEVEPDLFTIMRLSPFLNLYSFPSDLDYFEFGSVPDKCFRLDHMVRKVEEGPLGFDESFFDRPGKKVFLSLGSMGSVDVQLMKRLVSICSKSKHQFIISKGLYHDKYELAENMVGGKYVNQMAILPKVDLVIHHGGNNSFVETIYFGKPCIVLPLFGDQHDNGRRVEDLKIGRSFRPHWVTEEELLTAIDELIEDKQLAEKLSKIGEKVRNSKSINDLNKKIEEIVSSNDQQ
ncbi:uncharacterized UDP-glucosyltransferase YojK-like [Panonychus citri]|uniref:uncharacterized UDP-glucosyltransferase YojK-like n=1 Tax=Panonychus citri TaxID=50023 RepID=UPI002307D193|nr:uncharacterized UDP-glucosyltransferase YojK-like [Panonychus citri]